MRTFVNYLSTVALAGLLAACGGGGSTGTSQPATLSADQAAYESFKLSPNKAYFVSYYLPSTGSAANSQSYYFYDMSESLSQSPLTQGTQRVVDGPSTSLANTLTVQEEPFWFMVNGTFVKEGSPYIANIRYEGTSIVEEDVASDGKTIIQAGTVSGVTIAQLTGAVVSAPSEFKAVAPVLFSNGSLLKNGVNWEDGSAYIKYTYTNNSDKYFVYDATGGTIPSASTGPTPILTATTLASQLAGAGINFLGSTYKTASGTISTVNGVSIFVANTPLDAGTSSKYFQVFYEVNNKIYAGTLTKAGESRTQVHYNTAARTSLTKALTF